MSETTSFDWQALLEYAFALDISQAEFWDMTPAETLMVLEARSERRQRDLIRQAYLTARLTRAKNMPPLARLLGSGPAKTLAGPELEKRRTEFKEMTKNLDVAALVNKGNK